MIDPKTATAPSGAWNQRFAWRISNAAAASNSTTTVLGAMACQSPAQLPAVVHYLWLCFWPHRLIFDYGSALEIPSFRVVPCALIIAGRSEERVVSGERR